MAKKCFPYKISFSQHCLKVVQYNFLKSGNDESPIIETSSLLIRLLAFYNFCLHYLTDTKSYRKATNAAGNHKNNTKRDNRHFMYLIAPNTIYYTFVF